MTKEETLELLRITLEKYFKNRMDAWNWLMLCRHYTHSIDDVHDIPERRADDEYIGLVFNKALDLYSHDFYVTHRHKLYSIFKLAHNTYYDSLKWEKSTIEWQRTFADVIRNCANEFVLTVLEIVVLEETQSYDLAYAAKREVSLLLREKSWLDHHDADGKPI